MKKEPRGIRNNNPLNIRKGNNWKGEIKNQNDPSFEQFESMQMGLRAGFKLLSNYIKGGKSGAVRYNTLEKIIRRWAPPSENATARYIDFVATNAGISPMQVLSFYDRPTMCQIVRAMAFVENGQWIDMDLIKSAYDLSI